jgi:hypothetical protein
MKRFCEKCGANRVESEGDLCGCCLPPVGIGDTVLSFDFPDRSLTGERACYAVGMIEGVGRDFPVMEKTCDRYAIRVLRRVFGGDECGVESGELIYPPVNGAPIIGMMSPKVTGGVVLLVKGGA